MGREARCRAGFDGESGEGRLRLESSELIFRGPFKLTIPLKTARVEASNGALLVHFDGKQASFDLGSAAALWAKAIREPKGLLDKLGIKPEQRVSLLGLDDADFLRQLEERGAAMLKQSAKELDHLFYVIASEGDLSRLPALRLRLRSNGALWILRPKGPGGVSEIATMAAGKAAGLVDVKVVGFSATHSAEKFVIPVAQR